MAAWMRGKDSSRCLLLLAAVLMVESSQLGSSRAKLNSIKSSLGGETPLQASNRSTGTYQGLAFGGSKKGKNLGQVGKHPQCALQPGEGGTGALEKVLCLVHLGLPSALPGVARGTGGEGLPEQILEGGGGRGRPEAAAAAGGRGAGGLGCCLAFALGQGHVQRSSANGWGEWPEWSFSRLSTALLRMMLASNTQQLAVF